MTPAGFDLDAIDERTVRYALRILRLPERCLPVANASRDYGYSLPGPERAIVIVPETALMCGLGRAEDRSSVRIVRLLG
jgi:hypothetical protein